jgi:hypothetical protein
MNNLSGNILLISGSRRSVGKTTFIREVIRQNVTRRPAVIKITPHFHEPTSGLIPIVMHENYRIFLETNQNSENDSSLFLQAGADSVFYIQTSDFFIEEAFNNIVRKLPPNQPLIVESTVLKKFQLPGLYLYIQDYSEEIEPSAKVVKKLADKILFSDGESFSTGPETVIFEESWKIESV